jgi:hypothetical protein
LLDDEATLLDDEAADAVEGEVGESEHALANADSMRIRANETEQLRMVMRKAINMPLPS